MAIVLMMSISTHSLKLSNLKTEERPVANHLPYRGALFKKAVRWS